MRKAILTVALSSILALSLSAANPNASAPPSPQSQPPATASKAAFQYHFDMTSGEIKTLVKDARPGLIFTLQTWLRIIGYYAPELKLDGLTGPTTRKEIGTYQKSLGLKPDGIPNQNWETPLEKQVRKDVQQQLSALGFYTGDINGVNNRATENAIKAYEKSINIPEVGTLAPFTLFHLFNAQFLPKNSIAQTMESPISPAQVGLSETATPSLDQSTATTSEQTALADTTDSLHNAGNAQSQDAKENVSTNTVPLTDSTSSTAAIHSISSDNTQDNEDEDEEVDMTPLDFSETFILTPPAQIAVAEIIQRNELAHEIAEAKRIKEAQANAEKQAQLEKVKTLANLEEPIKEFSLNRAEVDQLVIKARNPNIFFTQIALTLLDLYNGTLDGQNGPETREAIRAFEKAIGHPETGKLLPRWENPLRQIMYRLVQSRLKQDGFYTGDIDGLPGSGTREAIKAYEVSSKTEATGQLAPSLLLSLFNTDINNPTASSTSAGDDIPSDAIEDVAEDSSKPVSQEEDGELKADSNQQEEKYRTSVRAFELTHAKSTEENAFVQLQLAYLGFYTGTVDGLTGPGTTRAIKAFQKAFDLPETGKFDTKTTQVLEVETINKFQRYLQRTDYMKDNPTGTWGPKTRRAVGILKNRYGYQVSDKLDIPAYLILIDEEQGTKFAKTYYDNVIKAREAETAVKDTQAYLIGFGVLNGRADGKMGPATERAISTYRSQQGLRKGNQIDNQLLESFKKAAPKQAQAYLQQLGYPIKADGIFGNNSKKQLNAFLTKNNKPKSDVVTPEILIDLKNAVATRLSNNRAQSSTQQTNTNTSSNTGKTGTAPRLQKGLQQNAVASKAPSNTVNGPLQIIRNNGGNVVGCKVNNIQMGTDWCSGKRNGQSCRVLYKNGRVLSMNCR